MVCTDEMTDIQALERLFPTLPMKPGLVERREFEYICHGTQSLIANFEVATGHVIASTIGPTRTKADFAAHLEQMLDRDPEGEWIIVTDQLNTHKSEAVVRVVVKYCGLDEEALGEKGKSGVLASMESRAAFLTDVSHRIWFVYTPKHCSWINQVEIWFSILVRRLLLRGNFTSVDDLKQQILNFIEYFNKTMAKPFKWTYAGKVLLV
ncbi:transposase [Paenibacillus prosopidis]|uniref:transposase n=1 Tax=Paenibacillus prosopidis TaxID=630520 RepID=UPI001C6A5998|nr:transposase [Paenibacillus prosopidis]